MNLFEPMSRAGIVPRDYQTEAHDGCYRLWNDGIFGSLIRAFTGAGKTLMGALIADTWLRRGENYRVMIVSYERQLVWQFADEIEDYLGIRPGIEMEKETALPANRIVVASRQTLQYAAAPTEQQIKELEGFGVTNRGAAPKRTIESLLKKLRKGCDPELVRDHLAELNKSPEANEGWSRVHKFDPMLIWLIIFDEAHRHAYHLSSVGPLVDWFEKNPMSRRLGLTATPKRSDGVSLGDRMFPGVALDYPLYSTSGRCAVKDGYAVPYKQIYIEVEGVDFKSPELMDRTSESGFDDAAMALELEKHLATFVLPTLAKVEHRRTLIFSPSVDMAKQVAAFINVRRLCQCECGLKSWQVKELVGTDATCDCGKTITTIIDDKDQARELDGTVDGLDRKPVYQAHQRGEFQFLSVCGLCREGYNDPDIECVAIYRPVSKKASSLAEQMKGRGCRPLRAIAKILHKLDSAEERCRAIAESRKPFCLIIDLVGVTGLADCASTVQIYADGKPDNIIKRAEEIVVEGETDIETAIQRAETEEKERVEKVRLEREEAELRAKEEMAGRARAQANARFSEHDVGFGSTNPDDATDQQWKFIKFLGMRIEGWVPSKRKAGRIINMLKLRTPLEDVAYKNGIPEDCWEPEGPSNKQRWLLSKKGLSHPKTGYDASLLLDAKINPAEFEAKLLHQINHPKNAEALDALASDLRLVRGVLPDDAWARLAEQGRHVRTLVGYKKDEFEKKTAKILSELDDTDREVLEILS